MFFRRPLRRWKGIFREGRLKGGLPFASVSCDGSELK